LRVFYLRNRNFKKKEEPMKKMLLTSAAMALLVAVAPVARAASIQIQYQIGNGPIVTCSAAAPGPADCADVAGPPLDITSLSADSNSPGASGIGVLTSADVDLVNDSTSSLTFDLVISANGFANPAGSGLQVVSHIGGTVVTGFPGTTMAYQSCIDPTNAIETVSSLGAACPPGTFASGASGPDISMSGAYQDTKVAPLPPLGFPYSVNERFFLTLAPGDELNWSSSTVAQQLTPEPATIPLAGVA
jgi:hypothetical protein